jgi:hypothetical protein
MNGDGAGTRTTAVVVGIAIVVNILVVRERETLVFAEMMRAVAVVGESRGG